MRARLSGGKYQPFLSILLFCTLSLHAQTPRNVILFIGDGMGLEQVKAARCYNGAPLSFESFPAQGQVTTRSANNAVTDSAAAATAMATSFKVNNGVISVALPGNGAELETTLEVFRQQGKTTGLITTSYLTDATPGAFGAHESSRTSTSAIAADLLTQTQPNILFGGGGNGLTTAAAITAGYQVATDTAGFLGLDPLSGKLCALFGSGAMPYIEDYLSGTYPFPHLREMTAKALETLENSPNGFFLMVEAGRIDHAASANSLPEMIHETLELSRAVEVALNWVSGRTDTQIIVIADHETGGLTVTQDNGAGNYPGVTWVSSAHTAANVPVYALGVDAARVSGILDNTYIHSLCTGEALSLPMPITLVPKGSTWKYDASGTDLGTAWRELLYADAGWSSGPARLGYGNDGELTRLPSLPVYPCYYFRHAFDVADPSAWTSLSLEILRDDGAVVYLNGQEVARYNMPAGTISFGTWASLADEMWDAPRVIPNLLLPGMNVIAVEIHQVSATSSDISLDLQLTGNVELSITPNAPVAGATGVSNPAALTVTPEDPAGNPVTVAFYGRPAPHSSMEPGPAFQLLQQNASVASGTPTTATWSGLLPGTEYEWFAVADDGPERALSETRRFTTLANVPPTVTLTSPAEGTAFPFEPANVTLTADAVDPDGAVASVEFFVGATSLGVDAAAPYEMPAIFGFGSHALAAVATDDEGSQTVSALVHITVGEPPASPSGLIATSSSRTEVALTWVDNSPSEAGFQVYQVINGSTYTLLGSVPADVTTSVVSGLQPSTEYTFMVRAFNAVGSADSAPANAITLPNSTPTATPDSYLASEDTQLAVPTLEIPGLLANDSDLDDAFLSAVLVDAPEHGTVALSQDGSFTYMPAPNFHGVDTFTYQVTDSFSNSAPAAVTITVVSVNDPPAPPADLAARASAGLVTLSWNASTDPDGDAIAYAVYRRETSSQYGSPIATVSGLSYQDRAVNNGTTYFYSVVAVDPAGASNPSNEVSATPDVVPVDVFASQNPSVTGTLSGDYTATFDTDGLTQTITETSTSTGARLRADYTLVSQAPPVGIVALSLFLNAQWTGLDGPADPLIVSLWNYASGGWEQITADIQDGAFNAAQPQNYISADGIMLVRFNDGAAIKKEKRDTLRIDSLFASFVTGEPDTTPPSAPALLSATAGNSSVNLDWADNTEPDLAGYNIYRSTSLQGDYFLVNPAPVRVSGYLDSSLANGTTYYYLVTGVDLAGNESAASSSVTATPVASSPITMHVEAIAISGLTQSGKTYRASATVSVVDSANALLAAAQVTAQWWLNSGGASSLLQTQTATTGANGTAVFPSPPVKAPSGSTLTLRVTEVLLSGYEFVPGDGVTEATSAAVP